MKKRRVRAVARPRAVSAHHSHSALLKHSHHGPEKRDGVLKVRKLTDAQKVALVKRQLEAQMHKIKPQSKPIKQSRRTKSPYALPIPGWNERRMTIRDFRQACEREGIVVLRVPFPIPGAYLAYKGVHTIWIDSGLRGAERLQVSFHELGHYFLHKGLPLLMMSKKKTEARRVQTVCGSGQL